MSRPCSIVACGKDASGYSTLCELHKRSMRRHGHAEQSGVTVHELQPFREAITARRAKNPGNPTWQLLAGRWQAVTGHAEAVLAAAASGSAGVSYERQTAQQLLILRDSVPDHVVIDTPRWRCSAFRSAGPHDSSRIRPLHFSCRGASVDSHGSIPELTRTPGAGALSGPTGTPRRVFWKVLPG